MRRVYLDNGYLEVRCPQILDKTLWERTGHWENYRENMFITSSENRDYAVKPMNCPGHIQIYNKGVRSYRDLPLRYGEFGACHRNEPSGALHGLMRVRGFTQDDGHIFCTEEHILGECVAFTTLLQKVYRDFDFKEIVYKVATRPEKRIGDDAQWEKAERALMESLKKSGVSYQVSPGEGAFYGPKIEYSLKDGIGRVWQCRQRPAHAGHAPSRDRRFHGALHRDPHRALRGRLPALARAPAGGRDEHRRAPGRVCRGGKRKTLKTGV
jgi:threonyl-tRNA synthetase